MLLRGAPLSEARQWLDRRHDELNAEERAFIQASAAAAERERVARERLRTRSTAAVLAGLAVAILLAAFAAVQWRRAEQ